MKTNFKASKTVLALAVAGLISSGAFATDLKTDADAYADLKSPVQTGTTVATDAFIKNGTSGAIVVNDTGYYGVGAAASGVKAKNDATDGLLINGGTLSGFQNTVMDLTGITATTITDTTFKGNSVGPVIKASGSLKLDNASFDSNSAGTYNDDKSVKDRVNGGAIQFTSDDRITGTASFIGNKATGNGGALGNTDGTTTNVGKYTIDLTDSVFSGNEAKIGGGAVYLQGQTVKFTDTVFTNNTAAAYGGAIRANGGSVEFVVTKGQNLAYTGNTTGTTDNASKYYQHHTGGFLYLQSGASAEFNVAADATLTIGTTGSTDGADSIASLYEESKVPTITKKGAGSLIVNSDMSGFVGNLTVSEGSMVIAGGIGSYDVAQQLYVNTQSGTKNGATNVTVGGEQDKDASLNVGDLLVNGDFTVEVKANGAFSAGDVTVDTVTYADTKNATKNTSTSTGDAEFKIAAGQVATIESLTLNAEGSTFKQTATDNGGDLVVNGDITVTKGTFTASAGTTKAANLTVAAKGTATGALQPTATITNTFETGNVTASGEGAVLVNAKGTLVADGTISGVKGGVSVAANAALETNLANLVDTKDGKYVAKDAEKQVVTLDKEATLTATDEIKYTLDEYQAIKTAIGSKVMLTEGEFIAKDAQGNETKAAFGDLGKLDGNNAGHSALILSGVNATNNKAWHTTDITFGSLEFVPAKDVTSVAELQVGQTVDQAGGAGTPGQVFVRGDKNGDLFILNGDAFKDTKLVLNKVVFGAEDEDFGTYNGTVYVNSDGIDVAHGNFTLGNVLSAAGASNESVDVAGTLTILGEETTQKYTPEGALEAVDYKVLTIGEHQYAADPQKPTELTTESFDGTMNIRQGGMLVAGAHTAAAQAFYAKLKSDAVAGGAEADAYKPSVLYIGQETRFAVAPTFAGASDKYAYIDLAGVKTNERDIVTVANDGQIQGVNLTLGNLHKGVVTTDEDGNHFVKVGSAFEGVTNVDLGTVLYENNHTVTNGLAAIVVDEENMADLRDWGFHSFGAVDQQIRTFEGGNQIAQTIIQNIGTWSENGDKVAYEAVKGYLSEGTTYEAFVQALNQETDGNTTYYLRDLLKDPTKVADVYAAAYAAADAYYEGIVADENTITNMAAYGGAFSTSFDINDQIRNTIDRRSSLANLNVARNATGITPWVDVMGTWNTADGLYGSSGYEADIYGATLGADYTASCGAILGAAISIGQADANSVDASTKVDNDVDFWGVSIYGSHRIGNVNGKFDIGYVSTSNDLSSSSAYFGRFDESLDADIFTVGVGAEYLATVGSLNVVPHAGIRWSSLDMDDSKYGADYDKMNLFQMPIGVAFSGTFDMTGWKVAPMLDISVVPTFGDKDAVASYTGGIKDTVRVVDSNPVQMTLGVNATVDAWTLGVNYGLSAGSDERLNNAFNFHARYTF